jgi:hypothetical protein
MIGLRVAVDKSGRISSARDISCERAGQLASICTTVKLVWAGYGCNDQVGHRSTSPARDFGWSAGRDF